jgi:hypothetical protein
MEIPTSGIIEAITAKIPIRKWLRTSRLKYMLVMLSGSEGSHFPGDMNMKPISGVRRWLCIYMMIIFTSSANAHEDFILLERHGERDTIHSCASCNQ